VSSQKLRQYQRFTRVNTSVWLIVLAAIAWAVLRHVQGTLDLTPGQLIALAVMGIISAGGRTWVGLRDPHIIYSFTIPLAVYDILVISVAVALTGKFASEGWTLYLMLLVSEAAVMTTRTLLVMVGVAVLGYLMACFPLPAGLWIDFGYRAAAMGLLPWLIHHVHRTHLEYRAELAELRKQLELGRERERIAQEFHDGLGNTLVQVIMGLERLCRQTHSAEKHDCLVQEQIRLLRGALDETRLIIQHLHADDTVELSQRIRMLAQQVASRLGVELRFDCPESLPDLPPLHRLMLTRVIQEALNNIAKHAREVHTIHIQIDCEGNHLKGRIHDDGIGFNPDTVIQGFGVHHMQERIESLGGQFRLQSEPGAGTCVEFEVPLEAGTEPFRRK
jgi:signal transduction histidine kinase